MMRNTWILLFAQALNGSSGVVAISLGGLTGAYLLGPDKSLATLPAAGYSVGLALGAYPAAILMQWIGRRLGLADRLPEAAADLELLPLALALPGRADEEVLPLLLLTWPDCLPELHALDPPPAPPRLAFPAPLLPVLTLEL